MEIENFDNRPKSKNGELIVNCRESSSGSVTHKPLDWPNCDRERESGRSFSHFPEQKYLQMDILQKDKRSGPSMLLRAVGYRLVTSHQKSSPKAVGAWT